MTLFHWQATPHQYYHGFWVNLFQNPKELIFTQNDAKALSPKPMTILYHQSPCFKLMEHHLIFSL